MDGNNRSHACPFSVRVSIRPITPRRTSECCDRERSAANANRSVSTKTEAPAADDLGSGILPLLPQPVVQRRRPERLSQFHNSAAFIPDMNVLQHSNLYADRLFCERHPQRGSFNRLSKGLHFQLAFALSTRVDAFISHTGYPRTHTGIINGVYCRFPRFATANRLAMGVERLNRHACHWAGNGLTSPCTIRRLLLIRYRWQPFAASNEVASVRSQIRGHALRRALPLCSISLPCKSALFRQEQAHREHCRTTTSPKSRKKPQRCN